MKRKLIIATAAAVLVAGLTSSQLMSDNPTLMPGLEVAETAPEDPMNNMIVIDVQEPAFNEVPQNCHAKTVVIAGTFQIRELNATLDKALTALKGSWDNEFAQNPSMGISHASYVDMQRITRDIYRKTSKGEWRIPAEHMMRMARTEMRECIFNGF